MKILLIDNYDSFTHNIIGLLKQINATDITLVKNDGITIHEAALFDKIIISPGPATPTESGNILDIIKHLSASHAILGICLGHQAIAEAFGGKLINETKPYHGFTTNIQLINAHHLFDHILTKNNMMQVGLYHSWSVDASTLPDCLIPTSISTENIIMSLKHKNYDVHGVQFHPESYMTIHGAQLIKNFLG